MGWEMSLEDVQEDEDDEEEMYDSEESDGESMEDNTVLEATESQELCEVFKVFFFQFQQLCFGIQGVFFFSFNNCVLVFKVFFQFQ